MMVFENPIFWEMFFFGEIMGGCPSSCPFNFFDIVFEGTLPQKTSKQAWR